MLPFPDLTNREFGRLWVIGLKEVGRYYPSDLWLCQCKCGSRAAVVIPGEYLRLRETWSCGCDTTCNYPRLTSSPQFVIDGVVRHHDRAWFQ
jgi:hypothetical protein